MQQKPDIKTMNISTSAHKELKTTTKYLVAMDFPARFLPTEERHILLDAYVLPYTLILIPQN
jgi:hypothetical protein